MGFSIRTLFDRVSRLIYMHTPLVTKVRILFDSLTTSKDSRNIHLVIRTHQGRLVHKGCSPPRNFEKISTKYLNKIFRDEVKYIL